MSGVPPPRRESLLAAHAGRDSASDEAGDAGDQYVQLGLQISCVAAIRVICLTVLPGENMLAASARPRDAMVVYSAG